MIRLALEAANRDLTECWELFADLKNGRIDPARNAGIASFQLRLVDAIAALEGVYRSIKREERRLVGRKARLNAPWFRRRMATLASYKKLLADAMAVGRAIGDGFAWIFYERDRDLISEHLKQQRQPLLPPRVGALGERAAVGGLQVIDGRLLLYHGITTFLRLGDVSLVDLNTMRVVSLGEIKTQQIGPTEYVSTINLVGLRRSDLPRASGAPTPRKSPPPLELHIKAKLERQSRQIGQSLTRVRDKVPQEELGQDGEFCFDALKEVVQRSHTRHFEYIRAAEGLILGAFRISKRKGLAGSVGSIRNLATVPGDAVSWVNSMMVPDRQMNALIMGNLGSGAENLIASAEELPFAWWPLSRDVLRDILFGNVMVVTLYNPAHLWLELRERGFELTFGRRHALVSAVRIENGRRTELHNFDYYHRLISRQLMTQTSVLRTVDLMIEMGQQRARDGAVQVHLRPMISRPPEAVLLKSGKRSAGG